MTLFGRGYRLTSHAAQRMEERGVMLDEIVAALPARARDLGRGRAKFERNGVGVVVAKGLGGTARVVTVYRCGPPKVTDPT